ncbi:MAG: FtsW/RodA/SpoVE family cell cycle protein [Actinomycetota bacterium]
MRSTRRSTELGLIVMAGLVITATYTLLGLGRDASLPADVVPFLIQLYVLFGLAHVAVRRLAPSADPLILPIAVLLNGLGYVFIARLDQDLAALQAQWTLLGIAAFVVTLLLVDRAAVLARYRWTMAAAGLVLLLLPLLPGIGATVNGARLWIRVAGASIQPGEFAKVAFAIFLAGYLAERREILELSDLRIGPLRLPDPRHLGPLLAAWGASLLVMVFERDLGSSLLLFTVVMVVIWVATGRLVFVIGGVSLFAVGAFVSWSAFSHVQERIDTWLDPWSDPLDSGFQLLQATFSLAEGGLTGTGPGLGDPTRIPAAETDFIFAVIAEELGLMGATAILVGFLLMIGSGYRIAVRAERPFDSLLATGLTTIIAFQSFLILGGVLRVVPLTGITLPFVSYGGSSLIANYILIALLLRISNDVEGGHRTPPWRPFRRFRREKSPA